MPARFSSPVTVTRRYEPDQRAQVRALYDLLRRGAVSGAEKGPNPKNEETISVSFAGNALMASHQTADRPEELSSGQSNDLSKE